MSPTPYLPICDAFVRLCDAFVRLLSPLVEVVIHDLATHRICHISGNLSGRKVGDPSLLETATFPADISETIYPKINFDGRLIKSISIPIEGERLICINCDISIFNEMKKLGSQLLIPDMHEKPRNLFKNDWQERLHIAIHSFIDDKKWQFGGLNNNQKKDLIKHLYESGAFREKNAADYVARVLSIARATIFNHLREWRKNETANL